MLEMWTYRTTVVLESAVDLTGFKVEAVDGSIGKVDEWTADAGKSHIVVDTGPWIFGLKVVLPAQRSSGSTWTTGSCTSIGPRKRSRTTPSSTGAWDRSHVSG